MQDVIAPISFDIAKDSSSTYEVEIEGLNKIIRIQHFTEEVEEDDDESEQHERRPPRDKHPWKP